MPAVVRPVCPLPRRMTAPGLTAIRFAACGRPGRPPGVADAVDQERGPAFTRNLHVEGPRRDAALTEGRVSAPQTLQITLAAPCPSHRLDPAILVIGEDQFVIHPLQIISAAPMYRPYSGWLPELEREGQAVRPDDGVGINALVSRRYEWKENKKLRRTFTFAHPERLPKGLYCILEKRHCCQRALAFALRAHQAIPHHAAALAATACHDSGAFPHAAVAAVASSTSPAARKRARQREHRLWV